MYPAILMIHSLLRWAVLALIGARAIRGGQAMAMGAKWEKADKLLGLAAIIAMDLQLLLGIALFGLSPKVQAGLADMGTAMGESSLRFWVVEHPTMMLLGVVAAHAGYAIAKRGEDDAKRHRAAAWGFGVALLLFGAGLPWAFRGAL